MGIKFKIYAVIFYLLALTACDDPEAPDCFKKSGQIISENFTLESFRNVKVNDGIRLLIRDSEDFKVTVTGGENLISGVDLMVENDTLHIYDRNSCRWVRDYKPLEVEISTNNLNYIVANGYGDIESLNTLHFDRLRIESRDGSGDFKLDVDLSRFFVVNNSLSNFNLSGKAKIFETGFWYNDGRLNGQDLVTETAKIGHHGVNKIAINVTDRLEGVLSSRGIIEYHGNPAVVDISITGTGKVVKAN